MKVGDRVQVKVGVELYANPSYDGEVMPNIMTKLDGRTGTVVWHNSSFNDLRGVINVAFDEPWVGSVTVPAGTLELVSPEPLIAELPITVTERETRSDNDIENFITSIMHVQKELKYSDLESRVMEACMRFAKRWDHEQYNHCFNRIHRSGQIETLGAVGGLIVRWKEKL